MSELARDGWTVLRGVVDPEAVARVRASLAEVPAEGGTIHCRLDAAEWPAFDVLGRPDAVLAALADVVGPDPELRALDYRAPLPGFGLQGWHADWPEARIRPPYLLCNVFVPLVAIGPENGATRVLPGSHRGAERIPARARTDFVHPRQVSVRAEIGDAVLVNGHLLHAGDLNRSRAPRPTLRYAFFRRSVPFRTESSMSR